LALRVDILIAGRPVLSSLRSLLVRLSGSQFGVQGIA
jgi:hypothetical protein